MILGAGNKRRALQVRHELEEAHKLLQRLKALEYAQARKKLGPFVRAAWDVLEPETELLWNWHHELTCEYLEAVRLGQIKRLLINIPPRTGTKTIIASICFPCWYWVEEPHRRFLFSSYADVLATRNSVHRRNLLSSSWYSGFASEFKFVGDVNRVSEFANDKTGFMKASGILSVPIGEGGDGIIVDDPHNPKGAESEKDREAVAMNFDLGWSRRLNNAREGFIVVIMQRLHETDLTGHILEKDLGYTQLRIPMVAEDLERHVFPLSGRVFERVPGQYMHPERFGPDEDRSAHKELGDYGYAGQMQQTPVARGGNLFRENMFEYGPIPKVEPGQCPFIYTFITGDTAYKDKQTNDFQCFSHWGVTTERLYLINCLMQRLKAKEVEDIVLPFIKQASSWGFLGAYIEPKGHGIFLNQKLPELGVPMPSEDQVKDFFADRRLSKVERANAAIPFLSTRKVVVNEELNDKEQLVLQVLGFPKARHDDFTDTLIDAIKRAYASEPTAFDAPLFS